MNNSKTIKISGVSSTNSPATTSTNFWLVEWFTSINCSMTGWAIKHMAIKWPAEKKSTETCQFLKGCLAGKLTTIKCLRNIETRN